jgi:hypothetical protein
MRATAKKPSHYKSTTGMIHLVGSFPAPRRSGTTQCGQPLTNMVLLDGREMRKLKDPRFCAKCSQLLGLTEHDV